MDALNAYADSDNEEETSNQSGSGYCSQQKYSIILLGFSLVQYGNEEDHEDDNMVCFADIHYNAYLSLLKRTPLALWFCTPKSLLWLHLSQLQLHPPLSPPHPLMTL
jgi:hypothetical protein